MLPKAVVYINIHVRWEAETYLIITAVVYINIRVRWEADLFNHNK